MKNNKGFTLIELLAVILILAIVLIITAPSILTSLKNGKKRDYDILLNNIIIGCETFYSEYKYANTISDSDITSCGSNCISLSLNTLVKYGFLTSNVKDGENKYAVINPDTKVDIGECRIKITETNNLLNSTNPSYKIENYSSNAKCPTNDELKTISEKKKK